MKKLPCLLSKDKSSAKVLVKDYGDTSSFSVIHVSKSDTFIRTDKRIKSVTDFTTIYGYETVSKEETLSKIISQIK